MQGLGSRLSKILEIDSEELMIRLRFSDGFIGRVSLKDLFEKPKYLAAEILKGQLFSQCFIENGALAWPNGFELCPDALRKRIKEQNKRCVA